MDPSPSMLVRRWSPANSIARGSEDWELVEEIKEFLAKEEKKKKGSSIQKVQKNTYDAFLNTNLASILEREKVERVVVTGCMVSLQIYSLARKFTRTLTLYVTRLDRRIAAATQQPKVRSIGATRRGRSVMLAGQQVRNSTRLV